MVKMQRLDTQNKTVYVVDCIDDWNEFTQWLYDLQDDEISLMFSGNVYHFRTAEERRYFVLGFSKAWDLIDDTYLEKYHGEK